MGLFNDLPLYTFTVEDLVQQHGTDREFTGRMVRALTAASIFEEVHEGAFRQTAHVRYRVNEAARACAVLHEAFMG